MRRRFFVPLLLAGLSVGGLGAAAGPHILGDGPHPFHLFLQGQIGRLMTLRSELDVTPEQRENLQVIVKNHKSEIVAVAKPIVEQKRALRDATLAKEPNEAAIRSAADNLGKSIGDAAVLASKLKGEAAKVLTPDQVKKIENFRTESDNAVDSFIAKIEKQ
jgi:Spy/CpxP family protein refolding chaperone